MTYFSNFPKIQYSFQNNKSFEMVDMFKKAVFSQNTLNNETVFDTHQLTIGASPEVASFNFYNNSAYSWILFASNNLVNPHTDWPVEWTSFLNSLDKKYNGISYYIFKQPPIEIGDVIIKLQITGSCSGAEEENYSGCTLTADNTTYAIVKDWNIEFRYLTCVGGAGITFSEGDIFAVARKDSTDILKLLDFGIEFPTASVAETKFSVFKILRADEEKNAIEYFLADGKVISPYIKLNPVNANGSVTQYYSKTNASKISIDGGYLTDSDNFYGTALYCYSAENIKGIPTILQIKTKYDVELEENSKKYQIKALKPGFLSPTFGLFEQAINSSGRVFEINLSY
jgi:hypothetical protein